MFFFFFFFFLIKLLLLVFSGYSIHCYFVCVCVFAFLFCLLLFLMSLRYVFFSLVSLLPVFWFVCWLTPISFKLAFRHPTVKRNTNICN